MHVSQPADARIRMDLLRITVARTPLSPASPARHPRPLNPAPPPASRLRAAQVNSHQRRRLHGAEAQSPVRQHLLPRGLVGFPLPSLDAA
ncbi:hypothetical protein ABZP36_008288 [Zizania latifolia]